MRVGGAIALACAGLACAVGARPGWLDGRHPEYPRERYLVGVGDAAGLDGARDRARAEIARVFEVRVEDEAVVRVRSESVDAGVPPLVQESIDVWTRTRTDVTLQGVEIRETWTDPSDGRVFALAVLEIRGALRALDEGIEALDAESEQRRARAVQQPGDLERARELVRAVRAARDRDELAARARVLGAPPRAVFGAERAALDSQLRAAWAGLVFTVSAREYSGSVLDAMRDVVAARLGALGLRVVAAAPRPVEVSCRLGLTPVERADATWNHVSWEGTCAASDAGRAVFTVARAGAESHPVMSTARHKARERGIQQLARAFERDLRRYLFDADAP